MTPGRNPEATTGRFHVDLIAVGVLAVVGFLVLAAPVELPVAVTVVVGLPFLLFAPGYAVVAALYPTAAVAPTGPAIDTSIAPQWPERLALAVALSALLTSAAGLIANFVVGIFTTPVAGLVTLITVIGVVVAQVRRTTVAISTGRTAAHVGFGDLVPHPDGAGGVIVVVAALVALLIFAGTAAIAIGGPDDSITEFYLVDGPAGGESVVVEGVVAWNEFEHTVGIEHAGEREGNYTVVAVAAPYNDTNRTGDWRTLDRGQIRVPPGETRRVSLDARPTVRPGLARISYLLYEGQPGPNASVDDAFRELHVYVRVDQAVSRVAGATSSVESSLG